MKTNKSIKRSLAMSILALIMCAAMLVGTTYAWFTDSVTSANNIIVSGNLDVELYYQVEGQNDWTKVTETTNIFKENTLWEPGHTEVVKLKVVNEGTLALKYNLGVNVAKEIGSVNVYGDSFLLSEFIKFAVIDGANTYTRDEAVAAAEEGGATPLKTAYNSGTVALLATEEAVVTMVVYMPEEVGNEANPAKDAAAPTINLGLNLVATQFTNEEDSFDNEYDADAMTFVKDAAEAQAALDNATADTIIKLAPGVDYGTLYLRPIAGQENTVTDCDYLVYRNEMLRKVENLTIIGAPGATVDAISVVSGYIEGSTGYVVDIKNLVIDSVEFTADYVNPNTAHKYSAPLFFDLSYINVDGLTVKNCELIGENAKMNFVYFYGSGNPTNSTFETDAKNITITGNTVDGIARLCELRQTENVTITNNTIKNTAIHAMLLTVDKGTYTGNVTITGNTAMGINERFVRMAGAGAATVVIKDNVIKDYAGADEDYIKVTDSTGTVTVENNTITRKYVASTVDELKAALNAVNDGDTVALAAVDFGGVDLVNTTNNGHRYSYADYTVKNITIVGQNGTTFSGLRFGENDDKTIVMQGWTLKNIGFTGNGLIFGMNNKDVVVEGCTFTNTELQNTGSNNNVATNFTVKNCTFNGGHATRKTQLAIQSSNGLTVTGCTFINAAHNAMNIAETYGAVVIENNNIQGTADRALRFTISDANATLTIKNNTIVSEGDADGQQMKASGTVIAENITFSGNTWNGKTDSQISAGMVGSDYIVK